MTNIPLSINPRLTHLHDTDILQLEGNFADIEITTGKKSLEKY